MIALHDANGAECWIWSAKGGPWPGPSDRRAMDMLSVSPGAGRTRGSQDQGHRTPGAAALLNDGDLGPTACSTLSTLSHGTPYSRPVTGISAPVSMSTCGSYHLSFSCLLIIRLVGQLLDGSDATVMGFVQ